MELIQTNEIIAASILEKGNRKITAISMKKEGGKFFVQSINVNNKTFMLSSRKGHSLTQNCEDYIFYIQVPKNAETIY